MSGLNQEIFVEQAEDIGEEFLQQWYQQHPKENIILKKLTGAGAKLLIGPRGCGKTTLLLKAKETLEKDGVSFPVYVTFRTSLKMDTLYYTQSNGSYYFKQWILYKILEGFLVSCESLSSKNTFDQSISLKEVRASLLLLENIASQKTEKKFSPISINDLKTLATDVCRHFDKARVVLLLDDAAHAFSQNEQKDFFEIFREIKSREISPKAAIYPGVTSYSGLFNVGHDAEKVPAWLSPHEENYLSFMRSILAGRLPREIYLKLEKDSKNLDLICYAAYGIPRNLINIIHGLFGEDYNSLSLSATTIQKSIKDTFENTLKVFVSLKFKLKRYEKFIDYGEQLLNNSIEAIKEFNKDKPTSSQTTLIGIKKGYSKEFEKVLSLLEYSGLVQYVTTRMKGVSGDYELYSFSFAALIDRNAIGTTGYKRIPEMIEVLSSKKVGGFKKSVAENLTGQDFKSSCKLSLPPCKKCGAERISEGAKFCYKCGEKLELGSVYDEILNASIETLPITSFRLKQIQKCKSPLKTIRDIIMDDENQELLKVPQIGPYWSKQIKRYAEEALE